MEHRYRTVLFDLDGTLADTSPGILRSVRHAEKEMGFAPLPEEELDQVIGPPLAQSFPQMYGIDPETTQRMIQVYRAFYWEEGVLDIRVFDGMRELLDAATDLIGQLWRPPNPVRLISVTALDLTDQWETYEQEDLFSPAQSRQDQRQERLERAMDAIRAKYGRQVISFGESAPPENGEEEPSP